MHVRFDLFCRDHSSSLRKHYRQALCISACLELCRNRILSFQSLPPKVHHSQKKVLKSWYVMSSQDLNNSSKVHHGLEGAFASYRGHPANMDKAEKPRRGEVSDTIRQLLPALHEASACCAGSLPFANGRMSQ